VSGSRDKTIHVWDAVTGESVLGPLTGHKKCVTSVALSPDGEHIMSGSKDGTIRFWSAKTGEVILVSGIRNSSSVTSVAFFPRGSWAVAGSSELELWKWNKEKKVWQWKEYPAESFQEANTIRSMAFSPNGEIIVCGSGTNIQVWDSETGHLRMHLNPGNKDLINCVAISPDAKLIVSGSHNSTFMVWDVDTGNPVARKDSIPSLLGRLKGANTCKEVYSITISPDNKSIAVGTTSDLELYSYI
jgi:WD40 repeat protein